MNQAGGRVLAGLLAAASVILCGGARAEEAPKKQEPGTIQRFQDSIKESAASVENSVKSGVKKLEDEKLAEKTEQKLKQTFDDVVQGVERMGKDIEKKFQ